VGVYPQNMAGEGVNVRE